MTDAISEKLTTNLESDFQKQMENLQIDYSVSAIDRPDKCTLMAVHFFIKNPSLSIAWAFGNKQEADVAKERAEKYLTYQFRTYVYSEFLTKLASEFIRFCEGNPTYAEMIEAERRDAKLSTAGSWVSVRGLGAALARVGSF